MSKEITAWCLVCDEGIIWATYSTYERALKDLGDRTDRRIVNLTGQIPEPKKMQKVALYVYKVNDTYHVSTRFVTKEKAEKLCREHPPCSLVQWPYGPVLEVEE